MGTRSTWDTHTVYMHIWQQQQQHRIVSQQHRTAYVSGCVRTRVLFRTAERSVAQKPRYVVRAYTNTTVHSIRSAGMINGGPNPHDGVFDTRRAGWLVCLRRSRARTFCVFVYYYYALTKTIGLPNKRALFRCIYKIPSMANNMEQIQCCCCGDGAARNVLTIPERIGGAALYIYIYICTSVHARSSFATDKPSSCKQHLRSNIQIVVIRLCSDRAVCGCCDDSSWMCALEKHENNRKCARMKYTQCERHCERPPKRADAFSQTNGLYAFGIALTLNANIRCIRIWSTDVRLIRIACVATLAERNMNYMCAKTWDMMHNRTSANIHRIWCRTYKVAQ